MTSEQALVAELVDNEELIGKYFTKIRNNLEKSKKVDPSDQKRIKTQISNDLKSTQAVIETIKLEIQSLKSEENEKKFKDKLKDFTAKYKSFNEEYKQSLENTNQTTVIDLATQKSTGQETSLEMMNKGDAVLDESGKAIERMDKKVADAKDISKNIKQDLKRQMEQLDTTNKNLKEIDFSLGRAMKTLGEMAKIVATDKFIMTIIIFIMILIIAIIIFNIVSPSKGKYNQVFDIFGKHANATASTEVKK